MSQSLLLAGLLWSVAAPGPKEVAKKDTAPLTIIGKWEVKSCVVGGKEDTRYPGDSWEFASDGRIIINTKDKGSTYKVDDTKGPSEFDLIAAGKGGVATALKGIYKIDGDTLTICVVDGGDRATKFDSTAGMLITFKHVATKKE
jgi:uncharacterized protein (TIGR03067 family)